MKQGTKANVSGSKLENRVENYITEQLNVPAKYRSRTKKREDILLKSVPYKNIYGSDRCRSEFVLCKNGRKIRIECKAQYSKGSVDEKLPYLYMNFLKSIDEKEAVVVLDGEGFKAGAKDWLREKCKDTKINVMSVDEFQAWIQEGIPVKKYSRIKAYIKRCFT